MEEADIYLDALVDVDHRVQDERAETMVQVNGNKDPGQTNRYLGPMVNGAVVDGSYGTVDGVGVDDIMKSLEQDRGKTAKELSRLWKYLGGASPDD